MQSLWSRAIQSRTTCRCVSCLSTTAEGVTSRSAGAASRSRLRIGNSVTIFYTSIFAAAALADSRAKTQRRHDWEEKIAAVKAEVNELVDEEQRLLESLRSRRGNAHGLSRMLPRRGLGQASSSSSTPRVAFSQPRRPFHTESRLFSAASAANPAHLQVDEDLRTEELDDHDVTDGEDHDASDKQSDESYSKAFRTLPGTILEDEVRLKAIQKLALEQFAIRLLLRSELAHTYSGLPMNYERDTDSPMLNFMDLVWKLRHLRKKIQNLKAQPETDFRVGTPNTEAYTAEIRETNRRLDTELSQDLRMFDHKRISLQELLMRMSHNLLQSADPDRPTAFRRILVTFTRARQNDINDLLLRTLLPNGFYLSNSTIVTIISFLRKSKNLQGFDLFLQMLSGDGYSVNLGGASHYERHKINGLDMVIPPLPSKNPLLFSELITAALRFDQPERADAWLQAARTVGFFDNFTTLYSYIRFYSIRQDWEKGIIVLKRAVTFLVSSELLELRQVERLLHLMVHLCDACNQDGVSESLISAAMQSGFDKDIPLAGMDVTSITQPRPERWMQAAQNVPEEKKNRPLWQKCSDFANTFADELNALELPNGGTLSQKRTMLSARHAHEAMSTAQHEIKSNTTSLSPEQELGKPASRGYPQETQNDEFTALKDEVAQLRELVFQLRKDQIEDWFYQESIKNSDQDALRSQRIETFNAPSLSKTQNHSTAHHPETQDPSIKVEFERSKDPVDGDKQHTSPELPRTPAARRMSFLRNKQQAALKKSVTPDPFAIPTYSSQSATSELQHSQGPQDEPEMDDTKSSSSQSSPES